MPELKELAPSGTRRMSANPVANGGSVRKAAQTLPDFRNYAVEVARPGASRRKTPVCSASFLSDVMRDNMTYFRVFGPDETASNRLQRDL